MINSLIEKLKISQSAIWLEKGQIKAFISPALKDVNFKNQLIMSKSQLIYFLNLNKIYSKDTFFKQQIFKYTKNKRGPLSFFQEALWFIYQANPNTNAYHIPLVLQLTANVQVKVLQKALQSVITRHSILRTRFIQKNNHDPEQLITTCILQIDYREQLHQDIFLKYLQEDINRPFDLQQDIPIRVCYYETHSDLDETSNQTISRYLLINIHHIAFDGWSSDILLAELDHCYDALLKNKAPDLPLLSLEYIDFARWQRQSITERRMQKHLKFWQNTLQGIETLTLATDHPRPLCFDYLGDRVLLELSSKLTAKLRHLAKKYNATLYPILLTGFFILLYKYTYGEEIVIGTPVAHRNNYQLQNCIGYFVNSLPVVAKLAPEQTSEQLLQAVQHHLLQAQEYQDIPFEKLVSGLNMERDASRNPLFQAMFSLQKKSNISSTHFKEITLPDLNASALFDLTLIVSDCGDRLQTLFNYSISLFDKATIMQMSRHYKLILSQLCETPHQKIMDYVMLTKREYQKIIYHWNRTDKPLLAQRTVIELFQEQAAKTPQNIAIIFKRQPLTYAVLNKQANQLARYLRRIYYQKFTAHMKPDLRVALCINRSFEMITAILGTLKAGAAYVPIDPSYPPERIKFILQDSCAEIILTQAEYQQMLMDCTKQMSNQPAVILVDKKHYAKEKAINLPSYNKSNHLAYVIYTSGTMGKPKGVMIEHLGLINLISEMQTLYGITEATVATHYANFVFDASVYELFPTLTSGGKIILMSEQQQVDIAAFLEEAHYHHADLSFLPTPVLKEVLAICPEKLNQKIIYTGGSALNSVKCIPKQLTLFNNYGPTENTVCSTQYKIKHPDNICIGKAIANIKLYVLDATLQPVPIGVPGELYIGGIGLARGYLNLPELTQEKFIPNPYATDADKAQGFTRLYRTGDQVKWLRNSQLEFIGRRDTQVKIRGFRIELSEIETVLASHPDIKQCLVLVKEAVIDDRKIARLIAYYLSHSVPSEQQLRTFLKVHLPEYMIPHVFIKLGALPLSLNGKVDCSQLPDSYQTTQKQETNATELSEPLQIICKAFAKLLNLTRINIHDDFFKLGGDSLSAIRLVAILKDHFDITISSVFNLRTPKALVENLTFGFNMMNKKLTSLKKHYAKKKHTVRTLSKLDPVVSDYLKSVRTITINPNNKKAITTVLLTGATGFLGSYLLYEILMTTNYQVVLIVRGASPYIALERVNKKFNHYFAQDLSAFKKRINILNGDLEKDYLGLTNGYGQLAEQIDSIIHAAAMTKHYGENDSFYRANVQATRNLLALCASTRLKDFHYVSTSSVANHLAKIPGQIITEQVPLSPPSRSTDLYSQTKLLGELEVLSYRRLGVNGHIYRTGNLAMDSRGQVQANVVENAFANWMKSLHKIGSIPYNLEPVDLSPVDYTAKAILKLMDKSDLVNEIFHVFNPIKCDLKSILHDHLQRLSILSSPLFIQRVMDMLQTQPDSSSLIELLDRHGWLENSPIKQMPFTILQDRTEQLLKCCDFNWTPISSEIFEKYLRAILFM